ncbi:MAG: 2-succinyl-5-enolpyruvyl-6-hydroxy-3-cyclohexene-1-carboxylic-acid synthase [Cytophagales bacterium]|nr:2-succinyl-5-enolpyruvyl-6-hydroxy-3-cyclohexene-1-carboxylic-acid synthase [Cytophagales bacterium]
MILQPVINIAEICSQHKLSQAVICPGSRNAPITLAFARHPGIETFIISDERSAGFIALGLAQSSGKPVAVICTSGTAVANLYPAIIEAYYQQIPLIILTADRPPEWIDQHDGQTIRQENIFQNHVLGSFQFPISFDHEDAVWHSEKMTSEAILIANGSRKGPVHINIPIREPFYPSPQDEYRYNSKLKIIHAPKTGTTSAEARAGELIDDLNKYQKIMVVVGQTRISEEFAISLNTVREKLNWVFIGDIISNVHGLDHPITKHDIILKDSNDRKKYSPDLLITFGKSVLSKSLKNFLRSAGHMDHWHIGEDGEIFDSFKSLAKLIQLEPEFFFKLIENKSTGAKNVQISYFKNWDKNELKARLFVKDFFRKEVKGEFNLVKDILWHLPDNCQLHLANSMPVRYANFIGLQENFNGFVWSNRGTSGIDGCISTCVGHAINSTNLNVLITGDIAFFYDRNGFWHNHLPNNLRIVLLNNHGGGIFRLIDGAKQLHELEEFFETHQKLSAANTAKDFGLAYFNPKNIEVLPDLLARFFNPVTGPSILEIETNQKTNQKIFEDFNYKAAQIWEQKL